MTVGTSRKESHPIRDGVLQAMRGDGGIFTETADAVTRAVTNAAHEAGKQGASVAESINAVVKSAVHGVGEAGDDTIEAIKGITVGVLRGTRETGTEAGRTLVRTARIVVQEIVHQDGDSGLAARGLLKGAILMAKELGLTQTDAATMTAQSAFDTAQESGTNEAEAVCTAIDGTFDGVRVKLQNRKPGGTSSP